MATFCIKHSLCLTHETYDSVQQSPLHALCHYAHHHRTTCGKERLRHFSSVHTFSITANEFLPQNKGWKCSKLKRLSTGYSFTSHYFTHIKATRTLGLDTGHKLVINTSRSCYSWQNFTLKTKKSLKKFLTVVPEKSLFTNIKQYVGFNSKWHLISALNFFLGHFLFFNLKCYIDF